jgi:aspartyl protease family protein
VRRLVAAMLALAAGAAAAQTVTLQGMLGNKALLLVDGGAPKTLAPGESFRGVKVLSTSGDQAVVEVAGQRQTLRVGDAPASVGGHGATRGHRIVLTAGSGGHFVTPGAVNGKAVQFMVDTGATTVAMGVEDARRLGIDYTKGRMARGNTANGAVTLYEIRLDSVRIGEVEVYDVAASVLPGQLNNILLGNSFLERFQMTRMNDQLVLERRY